MDISVNGPKIYFEIPIFGGIRITQTTVSLLAVTILLIVMACLVTRRLSKRPGRMQVIADTTLSEFENYVAKLMSLGYEKIFENEMNGNRFAQFLMGDGSIYVYFLPAFSEVRVIEDRMSCTLDRFGFATPKDEGRERTVIYQYALMYDPLGYGAGERCDGKYLNAGMFYVMHLYAEEFCLFFGKLAFALI